MKKVIEQEKKEVEKIVASFSINRLQMDNSLTWLLDMEIGKILPETFLKYELEFIFNEDPYNKAIESVREDIEEIENENSLFQTEKTNRIKAKNRDIKNIKEDMEALKKDCPVLFFFVTVKELKYKERTTFVRMIMPDEAINEINDNKRKFKHYQAELTPVAEVKKEEEK